MGIVDVLAEDGRGEEALNDYVRKNARRHAAHRAIFQARQRVNPITLQDLNGITDLWVDYVAISGHKVYAPYGAGALIGLAGAIGGLGGVLVNLAFRQSFLTLKNGNGAYVAFIVFYLVCVAVTYLVFIRNRPGRLAGV